MTGEGGGNDGVSRGERGQEEGGLGMGLGRDGVGATGRSPLRDGAWVAVDSRLRGNDGRRWRE